MANQPISNTRRLLEHLLRGELGPLVRERRAQGVAWRHIAREIAARTGVDVAPETLRAWFKDSTEVKAG